MSVNSFNNVVQPEPLEWSQILSIVQRFSNSDTNGFGWQEAAFLQQYPKTAPHFTEVRVFWCRDGIRPEMLFSSRCREGDSPVSACPWDVVFPFFETVLESCGNRIIPPFVRLSTMQPLNLSNLHRLNNFNYNTMNWIDPIDAIATQEQHYG